MTEAGYLSCGAQSDQLEFNNNIENHYSDEGYVSYLM